jgi:hypothetical protein
LEGIDQWAPDRVGLRIAVHQDDRHGRHPGMAQRYSTVAFRAVGDRYGASGEPDRSGSCPLLR